MTDHTLRREDFVTIAELAATRQEIWPHLVEAWNQIGLPEPVADQRAFSLTLADHTLARRLGDKPLSTYLNCGSSMTGWNADAYRIRMTVRSVLERVDTDLTRLHIRIDATATSTGGASADPIQCTTRGILEEQVVRQVRERLAPLRSG